MSSLAHDLWACDISNWYKHPILSQLTFPTRFVDLPDAFIARLLQSEGLFARVDEDADFGSWSDSEWPEEETQEDDEQQERRSRQQETFPAFEKAIKTVLDRWTVSGAEGGVFPRLNWSSPMDAHWMGIGGSLRCTTVAEVLRFLEASDAVRSDLEKLAQLTADSTNAQNEARTWKPTLALRRWHDFHTPNEFRCFVFNNRLIAISQKDITNFWPFLVEAKLQNLQQLEKFFLEKMKGALEIDSCTCSFHSAPFVFLLPQHFPIAPQKHIIIVTANALVDQLFLFERIGNPHGHFRYFRRLYPLQRRCHPH